MVRRHRRRQRPRLRKIVERADLRWDEAREVLAQALVDGGWRKPAERNRAKLFALGLWGVPSFRLGDVAVWGQDRLWVIQEALKGLATTDRPGGWCGPPRCSSGQQRHPQVRREQRATYGLFYWPPRDLNEVLDSRVCPVLHERLLRLDLADEARTFNPPHVTFVHIHSAEPGTCCAWCRRNAKCGRCCDVP